jgi:hypothetical protein
MQALIDILVSIAIPLFAFGLNWQMRVRRGYTISAAADFVLAIAAFDLAALAAHDVFEQAMHQPVFRQNFVPLFLILFVFTAGAWSLCFLPMENKLAGLYRTAPVGAGVNGAIATWFFGSWAAVLLVAAPHIFAFVYR